MFGVSGKNTFYIGDMNVHNDSCKNLLKNHHILKVDTSRSFIKHVHTHYKLHHRNQHLIIMICDHH